MDQQGGGPPEQPPVRRVTVHDRRRLHPEGAVSASGDVNPQAGAQPGSALGVEPTPAPGAGPGAAPAAAEPAPNPLESQLEQARAEAASYLDDLQRLKAEFDNYRKRNMKEQTALVERASENLLKRLLPVLDNFELAVASAEGSREFDRMLKGIEMVYGELKEVLASEGLTTIQAKGRVFDPNVHEAALQVDADGDGEQYVAEELRSGYTIRGRVLRPAMVKVARRGAG